MVLTTKFESRHHYDNRVTFSYPSKDTDVFVGLDIYSLNLINSLLVWFVSKNSDICKLSEQGEFSCFIILLVPLFMFVIIKETFSKISSSIKDKKILIHTFYIFELYFFKFKFFYIFFFNFISYELFFSKKILKIKNYFWNYFLIF